MRDIYHALNLRSKLTDGQAFLEQKSIASDSHKGKYGDEVRTQIVNIKLASNGYRICLAHRYLKEEDGSPLTEPDPKYIHVDELKLYFDPEA